MRLWSIHPKYLDWMGLGALWRESLLAQKVLSGETKGWKSHPQLKRFKDHSQPMDAIGFYLARISEEASSRGYIYDQSKIRRPSVSASLIPVSVSQLCYEFSILLDRTQKRSSSWYEKLRFINGLPDANPIFHVYDGEVCDWEVSYWRKIRL